MLILISTYKPFSNNISAYKKLSTFQLHKIGKSGEF